MSLALVYFFFKRGLNDVNSSSTFRKKRGLNDVKPWLTFFCDTLVFVICFPLHCAKLALVCLHSRLFESLILSSLLDCCNRLCLREFVLKCLDGHVTNVRIITTIISSINICVRNRRRRSI